MAPFQSLQGYTTAQHAGAQCIQSPSLRSCRIILCNSQYQSAHHAMRRAQALWWAALCLLGQWPVLVQGGHHEEREWLKWPGPTCKC